MPYWPTAIMHVNYVEVVASSPGIPPQYAEDEVLVPSGGKPGEEANVVHFIVTRVSRMEGCLTTLHVCLMST